MTSLNVFGAVLSTGEFSYGKACVDCMFQLANGEVENDSRTPEQLALAEKNCTAYEFTLGHLHTGEWSTRCWHTGTECEDDCACERDDFDRTDCAMCGTGLAGYRHDCIMIDRNLLATKMTQEQFDKLSDLCRRYDVKMHISDYVVNHENSPFTPGWAEGWVGGQTRSKRTLYVGVSPEGESHS